MRESDHTATKRILEFDLNLLMFPTSVQNSSNIIKLCVLNHLSDETLVSIIRAHGKKGKEHHVFCTQISNLSSAMTQFHKGKRLEY